MDTNSEETFRDLYDMATRTPRAFIIALSFMGMDTEKALIMLRLVKQSKGDYEWYHSITNSKRCIVRVNGLTLMFREGTASWT